MRARDRKFEGCMISVKNYMEVAVRTEMARRKDQWESGRTPCWCPVCEADSTALALTTLPPRYCMESSYPLMEKANLPGTIQSAVLRAFSKVTSRPKHRPGVPDFYPHRVRLVNFGLEEGWSLVRGVMFDSDAPCLCSQCIADTVAFALNRVPAKYGVELDGSTRFPAAQRDFLRHDLGLVMGQAAKVISAHPHH